MLTRQLASAGSGKTYTLARQFIWLFITVPSGERTHSRSEQPRRLRTRPELSDSLRHILAITFTNKATGEMKQRIISKLAALAGFRSGMPTGSIDYLDDFSSALGVSPEEIARVSTEALDILLNDFSDFQVSTIDSFFQQVMRTFTYEAELPDNFQLELDSNYIAGLGLDSALTDLNTNRSSENFRYWTKLLVDTEVNRSGSWNLFSPGRRTLYTKVLSMLKTMESESFKENLRQLNKYFDTIDGIGDQSRGGRLAEIHALYDSIYLLPLKEYASKVRALARRALDLIATRDVEVSKMAQYLHGRIVKLAALNWKTGTDGKFTGENFMVETVMKKGIQSDPDLVETVNELGVAYDSFLTRFSDPAVRSWMVYSKSIRQLAVTWEIKKKTDELMLDANSIRLSDTNTILNTIIGDDETPFIYERIGSRLDHFLIDEFQDTSRLQWENTLPLLHESDSRGCENLIIGDPKQSIYRFRNADSSLITGAVRDEFPDLHDAGKDPKKNTNWRSSLNIVRFNNFLFHSLASLGMDYSDSYGDVIQYSTKDPATPEGLVRMRFYRQSDEADAAFSDGDENGDEVTYPSYFKEIPRIINDLRERGYRQRDIAILVGTHRVGTQVIDALLDFNSTIDTSAPDAPDPIRFVSEDSLKVTNAGGVRIVIEALMSINGSTPFTRMPVGGFPEEAPLPEGDDVLRKDPLEEYGIFATNCHTMVSDDLRRMLAGMSVVTLPALVEQIIATFVPWGIRKAEAPFLAALQDTVIEFCESHQPDIATFLKWWAKHGDSLTISSPESTDAVQVVTVHSSKGLEFGAVIIPDANYRFETSPLKIETVWLRPKLPPQPDAALPPCLPVELTKEVEGTYHEDELVKNRKEVATDKLNAAYVAFTRAKYELYTLCEIPKTKWPARKEEEGKEASSKRKKKEDSGFARVPAFSSLSDGFFKIMEDPSKTLGLVPSDKTAFVVDPDQIIEFRGETGPGAREIIEFTYGSPVDLRLKRNGENEGAGSGVIGSYTVNDLLPVLHFRSGSGLFPVEEDEDGTEGDEETTELPQPADDEEETEEEELIPGSIASLLREAIGKIASGMSVERAVLSLKVTGRWTDTQLDKVKIALTGLSGTEEGRKWFRPGPEWEIFANRPLIQKGRRTRTPDLLLISRNNAEAVIVNFKTTPEPEPIEWKQLKCHVRALRRTGFKGKIEAWLCHPLSALSTRLKADFVLL